MTLSMAFLIASPVVMALGLLKYRADYRRHGRTTTPGVVALLAAWFMPMCVLGFAIPLFPVPGRPLQYLGYGLMILGLALSLFPLRHFSSGMVVGRSVPGLVTGGAYRYSRNPQYVAFFPFVLGYAMTGRSLLAYAGVALYGILVHLTVRVEEEHLERVFGDDYRRFRATTPRYIPLRLSRSGTTASHKRPTRPDPPA